MNRDIVAIGLFGGTFDPIHNGHTAIATACLEKLGLTEIWFLADDKPRHKINVTDYSHRLEMIRLATSDHKNLISDRLRYQKKGETHGLNTLKNLIKDHPNNRFSLIMGVDSIMHLEKWEGYQEFLRLVDFIVVPRSSHDEADLHQLAEKFRARSLTLNYQILSFDHIHISSSDIKKNVRANKKAVDPKVYDYIVSNELYTADGGV